MKPPESPPAGPISTKTADALLRRFLGVERLPADATIFQWALMRKNALLATVATQDGTTAKHQDRAREIMGARGLSHDEVRDRRFGTVRALTDTTLGDPARELHEPREARRGRPAEAALDQANAVLLEGHPQLERAPLYFAMLEALFELDFGESVRFPQPGDSKPDEKRDSVRHRARQRIGRARALLDGGFSAADLPIIVEGTGGPDYFEGENRPRRVHDDGTSQ